MAIIDRMIDGSHPLDTLSIFINSDQWEENSVNVRGKEKISRDNISKKVCFFCDFQIRILICDTCIPCALCTYLYIHITKSGGNNDITPVRWFPPQVRIYDVELINTQCIQVWWCLVKHIKEKHQKVSLIMFYDPVSSAVNNFILFPN